ncbi:MAG TPA: UDP-N-acetylmuramoyl-L-alanine--D-glutamate ligase [Nevskiaceae bacterium]|nr:UDP-N-acetylmuramoyl-L-alanine--D-glutamate ligase [Nevskiaceae bacterium]
MNRRYQGQTFLVAGLGASGVSAANYLVAQGATVHVTDAAKAPPHAAKLCDKITNEMRFIGQLITAKNEVRYQACVLSPGISPALPFVQQLRDAGTEIIGDIELFARDANARNSARDANAPVIGITGSNGKSTVTTLVGEMARAAGLRAGVGGNLGTPALELLRDDAQLYVLELSSFQLETTSSLKCRAAALLNLSQDHLDRHGTMENYGAVKARIFSGCDVAVVNRDDPAVMQLAPRDAITFGLDAPRGDHYGVRDGWLVRGEEKLIATDALKIFGTHNWANALASLALAEAAGIERAAAVRALVAFTGLPHRCEFVAEHAGVSYFNDSKGTNVGSTLAALNGLPAPIVWLAGGQGKGQDFSELREPLARKGRAAVLFGEDAARIEHDVYGAVPVYRERDMQRALERARALAQRGDHVLLSPACASFDQFRNYVERGEKFRAAVRALA